MARDESRVSVGRRGFLATGLAAALLQSGARGTQTPVPSGMPRRAFGRTGRELPILAMGGSAMVRKWEAGYGPQLSFDDRVKMTRHAFESGVRYFDTSPNYGESEAIIGEALHDVRDQIYLATKVGVPRSDDAILTREQVRKSVEVSLQTLKMANVDCIQVHGPAFEYNGQKRAEELQEEVVKLREEGLCRYVGLTGHNHFETMFRLIDSGRFDQLLVAWGYFPKGMDTILSHSNLQWRERCLSRAHELGMGVVAMKVMASFVMGIAARGIAKDFSEEQIDRLRAAAIRWSLSDPRVTLAVVGVTREKDIDQNIATVSGDLTLTDDDRALLGEFSTLAFQSPTVQGLKVQ